MLRNLLSGVLRSRTGTAGTGGTVGATPRRGYGRGRATSDPGGQIGAQVGRSLFSALRRRG